MTPAGEIQAAAGSRVFAVIPVFNRLDATLACVACLKQQTWPALTLIVVDGGSTDGTPDALAQAHPEVVVLSDLGALWWAGATRHGMDWALAHGTNADFVLMINNDTYVDPDCVERLVATSRRYGAAVGGVVVDALDPTLVIDGGITLDWRHYRFHTVKAIPADGAPKLDCDVLPGRSTLVPMAAIRQVGAVDDKAFPHYIADYEFTHRLKRQAGLALVLDYEVKVRTRVASDEPATARQTLADLMQQAAGRRSKSNVGDHLRFIWRHAPAPVRHRLVRRLLRAQLSAAYRSLALRYRWLPLRGRGRTLYQGLVDRCPEPLRRVLGHGRRAAYSSVRPVGVLLFRPYLVSARDCERHQLSLADLLARRLLIPSGYPGLFRFNARLPELRSEAPELIPLYWHAWRPGHKLRTYVRLRRENSANRRSPRTPDTTP